MRHYKNIIIDDTNGIVLIPKEYSENETVVVRSASEFTNTVEKETDKLPYSCIGMFLNFIAQENGMRLYMRREFKSVQAELHKLLKTN